MLTVVLVVRCSTGACCGFNVAAMSVAASFTISTTVTPSLPELERRWVFLPPPKSGRSGGIS